MSSPSSTREQGKKLAEFETFINDVLKDNLKQIHAAQEAVIEEVMDLERVMDTIDTLSRLADEQPTGKPLKTRVNVGCDFYMQANVDVRKYIVCVGLDNYVEFTKEEALRFVQHRADRLKRVAEDLKDKNARVRSQITLALHCIEEVQDL